MRHDSHTHKVLFGLCVAKGTPKHRTQIVFDRRIRQGDVNLALRRLAAQGLAVAKGGNMWAPTPAGMALLKSMAKPEENARKGARV